MNSFLVGAWKRSRREYPVAMWYSLSNKFQGVLLGAAIGDFLGIYYNQQVYAHEIQPPQPSLGFNKTALQQVFSTDLYKGWRSSRFLKTAQKPSKCGELALGCMQSLIRCGGLNLQDYHETCAVIIRSDSEKAQLKSESSPQNFKTLRTALEGIGETSPQNFAPPALLTPLTHHLTASELTLAVLPITLFFHENKVRLREKLAATLAVWQPPQSEPKPVLTAETLTTFAIGYAIAQALKNQLDPRTLIPKTITYLGVDTPLSTLLLEVQVLLEQGAGLETVVAQVCRSAANFPKTQTRDSSLADEDQNQAGKRRLNPTDLIPTALAFYCFLSTVENLHLAIVRAIRTGYEAQLTGALTGALAGAYNSTAGIPAEWRSAVGAFGNLSLETQAQTSVLWGDRKGTDLFTLATRLLAVWSGVYDPSASGNTEVTSLVVTAPHVIRTHRF